MRTFDLIKRYPIPRGSRTKWDYKSWVSYAQPFFIGLLLALSMPPWGWWPLLILALLAWLHLIGTSNWKSRFINSFLVAFVWFLFSLIWMWDLTPVGYLATMIGFSLMYGVGGAIVPYRKLRYGNTCWLAFPAVVVLVEHLRSRWPFGGVPISTLAMGLVDSVFSHTVRLGGQLLMVFLVCILAVGISALIKKMYPIAGTLLVGVLLFTIFSGFAPTTSPTGETLDIAIVQGGGPQRVRTGNSNPKEVFDRHIDASEKFITGNPDLIVWPENVVDVPKFVGSLEEIRLANLACFFDSFVYAGIVEDFDEDTFLNYSVLLPPGCKPIAEFEHTDSYEKVRRVPFGEFVPLKGLIRPFAPSFLPDTEARIGSGPPIVSDGEHIFGTVISWEIFFEDRTREAARKGAEVLINPTNNSSFWLGIVQSQQVASSKLRALETGLWVVQAAPTGFSAFVDSSGSVRQKSSIGKQEVLQMPVELRSGRTLATRLGVWYIVGISFVLLAAAWFFIVSQPGSPLFLIPDYLRRYLRRDFRRPKS